MILQNQRLLAEICDNTGALVRLRPSAKSRQNGGIFVIRCKNQKEKGDERRIYT